MKKQGDSILVIGDGSHVFRNSRLNATIVVFLFSSEGSSGVLSRLGLSYGLSMALAAASIPCFWAELFQWPSWLLWPYVLRVSLCLLNKILVCLNQPKILFVVLFFSFLQQKTLTVRWLTEGKQSERVCGRAGVGDMDPPAPGDLHGAPILLLFLQYYF